MNKIYQKKKKSKVDYEYTCTSRSDCRLKCVFIENDFWGKPANFENNINRFVIDEDVYIGNTTKNLATPECNP